MDNENKKLSLNNYKEIWTPFCFLDESGTLDINSQPYYLQQKIRYIREKNRFWWEIKFNDINKSKIKTISEILEALFKTRSIYFSSYSIDKRSSYFKKEFNSDPFFAYEQITQHLLKGNLKKNEVLIVLADNIVTPKRNKFEVNVKNKINAEFDRLAIAGVCRLDSKTNDLLQLADILIGSINYELLINTGVIPGVSVAKKQLINKFKEYLGVKSLTENFRNYNFNIHHHFKDSDEMKKAIGQ